MRLSHAKSSWPWALVEITAGAGGVDAKLIRAAYHSSRAGVVGLALSGVDTGAVDRVLDGIVDASDEETKGVVYLDATDESNLFSAAEHAALVIGSSDRFIAELGRRGIRVMDARAGATALAAPATMSRAVVSA